MTFVKTDLASTQIPFLLQCVLQFKVSVVELCTHYWFIGVAYNKGQGKIIHFIWKSWRKWILQSSRNHGLNYTHTEQNMTLTCCIVRVLGRMQSKKDTKIWSKKKQKWTKDDASLN